jgi:phosphoribosylglycinamide formyltransferase-1
MENRRIGILISGRGTNMTALVDAVQAGRLRNCEIAVVISDQEKAKGLESARERRVDALAIPRHGRTREEHEAEIVEELQRRKVDLVCLAGFMRLLSPSFIETFRGRILNVHPSLLPAFPGLAAQRQALAGGVKWSGCTVHFVDETLDGGPIIVQKVVPVLEGDTEETLSERILVEEHKAYVEAVELVLSRL